VTRGSRPTPSGRPRITTLVVVGLFISVRLAAQMEVHLAAGARYTSTMVTDRIVAPFDVRPALAPTLAVTVLERNRGPWAPTLTLDLSWSDIERHDATGPATTIGSLATLGFSIGIGRQLLPGLTARAGLGGLKYLPGVQSGIFRDGAGITALGSLALDVAPRFAARHRLGLTVRYDAHRFITPALRSVGFTDARLVHRVGIAARVRLGGP